MRNVLVKTARKFQLCDKNDNSIVSFRLITLPHRYIVIDTELLTDEAVAILNLEEYKQLLLCPEEKEMYLNRKLADYLRNRQRDYKVTGYLLDDFIIHKLHLDNAITNFGRLNGMEYLIDLLQYHFYDNKNELYVTCVDPGTISFFHEVPGWKTLLFDFPVKYKDIVQSIKEDYDYVSVP